MTVTSDPYRLSRRELMLITAREYLRSYWWFAISTPIFGILALIFGDRILQGIGMMAILWPISIPARAIVTSAKSSRLFTQGCTVQASPSGLTFLGEQTEPRRLRMVLDASTIRDVVQRGDVLLIRTRKYGFAPVPIHALSEHQADFEAVIAQIIAKRDASITSE